MDPAFPTRLNMAQALDDFALWKFPSPAVRSHVEALGERAHHAMAVGTRVSEADHVGPQVWRRRNDLGDETAIDAEGEIQRIPHAAPPDISSAPNAFVVWKSKPAA